MKYSDNSMLTANLIKHNYLCQYKGSSVNNEFNEILTRNNSIDLIRIKLYTILNE